MTSWPTSTTPEPATAPPKLSTAESNTSAAPPYDSETSSTTSPEHSWTPADSDTHCAHCSDEPVKHYCEGPGKGPNAISPGLWYCYLARRELVSGLHVQAHSPEGEAEGDFYKVD